MYRHVCVCVYLLSCSIEGLSYTPVVQFFFQLMYILYYYYLFIQSIPSIYTSLEKTVLFCIIQANPFVQFFFSCPLRYLASPFLLNI